MPIPEVKLERPGGGVLFLRADHLAFFAMEQARELPLSEILRTYHDEGSYTEIYAFAWHLSTSWRADADENQISFEEFLRALPLGGEFTHLAKVEIPRIVKEAVTATAPVHEGGAEKKPRSSLTGIGSSLKQLLSARIRPLFGGQHSA